MDKSDMKNIVKHIIFPAHWPLVGHWFDYWVRWPAESLCLSFVLLVFSFMVFFPMSAAHGMLAVPTLIATGVVIGLSLTLFIVGISVVLHREAMEAARKKEKKGQAKGAVTL